MKLCIRVIQSRFHAKKEPKEEEGVKKGAYCTVTQFASLRRSPLPPLVLIASHVVFVVDPVSRRESKLLFHSNVAGASFLRDALMAVIITIPIFIAVQNKRESSKTIKQRGLKRERNERSSCRVGVKRRGTLKLLRQYLARRSNRLKTRPLRRPLAPVSSRKK